MTFCHFEQSKKHLEEACHRSPQEATYHSVLALIQLKLGDIPSAAANMKKALDLPQSEYQQNHNRLYLGRMLDLLGQRSAAIDQYQKISSDSYFHRKALKGIKSRYRQRQVSRFVVDFTIGEAIEPR